MIRHQGNSDLSAEALSQLKFVKEQRMGEDENCMLMMLLLFLAMDDSPSIWGS